MTDGDPRFQRRIVGVILSPFSRVQRSHQSKIIMRVWVNQEA